MRPRLAAGLGPERCGFFFQLGSMARVKGPDACIILRDETTTTFAGRAYDQTNATERRADPMIPRVESSGRVSTGSSSCSFFFAANIIIQFDI